MKYKSILAIFAFAIFLGGCQKDFLQMPVSSSTTVDTVFSTTVNAQYAIAQAYKINLSQGIAYQGYWSIWNSMIQENLSGTLNYGFSWTKSNAMVMNGYTATGDCEDMDGFNYNYTAIRQAYLVKENIDKVKDMSSSDKAIVKAEMQSLIAYRYGQMMIIFGGVPIVSHSFSATDNPAVTRNPVKEVLDSVVAWCDQSAAVLPSKWSATFTGRMTKAAALAIKAKALLYGARPLFNSASPYLNFGSNNNLICFGNADPARWATAAAASEAVITEAESNGGFQIINTGNPLADYGTATSTPGNAEVLLAFKYDNGSSDNFGNGPMSCFYNAHDWSAYGNTITVNALANYYKADGSEQSWPNVGTVTVFSDYLTRMGQMEPRFLADFLPVQMNAANNPGDSYWANSKLYQSGYASTAIPIKFYYKAGTRNWFEFPIFRLAAAYLSSAEAFNESGQTQNALARLNKIHTRAGLPAITITDQATLRSIIQREWAIEFFDENYRLHDVKHWMLPNIGNGILGGAIYKFTYNNGVNPLQLGNTNYQKSLMYTAFWAPKEYLNPFPQSEVNKGIIIQNPGY